jgi:signal transduction histidine kinase
MSESRLLSGKGVIYFVLPLAVLILILLNFGGWFFLRGIERQNQQARLGQMTAMAAHEIRNPLSIIKGSAEVLRMKYASQNDELFEFIPEEINRLNRLVNDFLQFARRREIKLEKQNPVDVINSLLQQMNDPRIQTGFANPAPEMMLDNDSFKQVILNILDNARQAVAKEGRIQIRSGISRQRSRQLMIEIEDNSPGMPSETLEKMFDPFFSTRAAGCGLGMPITRQLVEQMGGKIAVFSKEGRRTIVKLEFPA